MYVFTLLQIFLLVRVCEEVQAEIRIKYTHQILCQNAENIEKHDFLTWKITPYSIFK